MSDASRVLVVDDDPGVLRLLSIRLRTRGYEVSTAESGEQALASFASFRPQLIITDLRMDGMDGMAVFEHVRRHNPTLPVIILTAHGSIPEAVSATKNGAAGFVTKPFEAAELLAQVEDALRLSGGGPRESQSDPAWRSHIITRSAVMEDLLQQVRLVGPSEASVSIHGQSGTGKELIARAVHKASPRAEQAFVAVNCGAIPENLLESELFGHRKGAFTGASADHEGLFSTANKGTLFLDEIGDMPLALQVKLLRVLQEGQIRPVGSTKAQPVDVRIVSATHRDIDAEMSAGRFREDLYYRLNVIALALPPLAERREDIPLLAEYFLQQIASKYRKELHGLAQGASERLISAPWPGNVRQLYNVVEQAAILSTSPIVPEDLVVNALRDDTPALPAFADARRDFERDYLVKVLQVTQGNVSRAARLAKRNRTEFYKLLNRHELDPGLFKRP